MGKCMINPSIYEITCWGVERPSNQVSWQRNGDTMKVWWFNRKNDLTEKMI